MKSNQATCTIDKAELIKDFDFKPPVNLPDSVTIRKVENGFIIQVGCRTFVTKEWSEVNAEVGAYFANPAKAADKWLD